MNKVLIKNTISNENGNLFDKSLLVKLKQNPNRVRDLIRHKIVINLPDKDDEAQKVINSIKEINYESFRDIKWYETKI